MHKSHTMTRFIAFKSQFCSDWQKSNDFARQTVIDINEIGSVCLISPICLLESVGDFISSFKSGGSYFFSMAGLEN